MGRKKFMQMTLSDEDMKQALIENGVSKLPASRQEAEDKLLSIGWTPSSQHIAKYNQIRAEQEEIVRQQRVANQEVIIEHEDLGNLDKFSERDLKKWIDDDNLGMEVDSFESKQDYMEFINQNHTFISPQPTSRMKVCPK